MTIHLDIPESVAANFRLPSNEVEPRLRSELAVAPYTQGIVSFGKASDLAGFSRYALAELLAARGIPRQDGEDELAQDIGYAHGQQYLADI